MASVYDFEAQTIDGQSVALSAYQGKVLLIVNTASACGFTPQFAGLEKLHQEFASQGLVVLGFPCNQFGGQDPGSEGETRPGAFAPEVELQMVAHLHEFRGQREKLPFDQHWFLALCAPRPFLALEGDTDTISLPAAVRAAFDGAKPAYALFGADAPARLGVHYAPHGHAFTAEVGE